LANPRAAWSLVQALGEHLPLRSQLVVTSRSEVPVPIARWRAQSRLVVLDGESLAMDVVEATALFEAAGVALHEEQIELLVDRTEGWPTGLYLAALAVKQQSDVVAAVSRFAGDDRLVADYLREEIVRTLPRRTREFLTRASVLETMTAAACDSVLDREGSSDALRDAARQCSLVIPLDRAGATYRLHQLLLDALRAELHRTHPALERTLHERASRWCEAIGDFDGAVSHAAIAADDQRSEALIWTATPVFTGDGRTATVERWLSRYTHDEIAARPALAVSAAWSALTAGDAPRLAYWARIASAADPDTSLPDGTRVGAAAALLRAGLAEEGIEQMRADAALAFALDRPGSPYRGIARFLEGSALRLLGRPVEARDRLADGAMIGALHVRTIEAHCLAGLAAVSMERGDDDQARELVDRSLGIIEQFDLVERPAIGYPLAIAALVCARTGDSMVARGHAKQALFNLATLGTIFPWGGADARIMLARTALLLGDVAMARELSRDARGLLVLVGDRHLFDRRLAELEHATDAEHLPIGVIASPMTPAELRVLRYLPTRLTFAAIADELYVSRNTVKTQAISIYRKLGVSARDSAVASARALGLLDDSLL
jgi:LuxR family maltose regulon positive regulatory protein